MDFFQLDPLFIFLAGILLASAVTDLKYKKIPNMFTFSTVIVALAYHCATQGWRGVLFSLGGLALGIAFFIFPYILGGMGAGDVKLMGAVGAVLGPAGAFNAFLLTAVAGLACLLLVLLRHLQYSRLVIARATRILKTLFVTRNLAYLPATEEEKERKPILCYGVAIAGGTLCLLGWMSYFDRLPFNV
jgi:prepilin peptidase CpaA